MYIVITGRKLHSAWISIKAADHQKEVLENHGYHNVWITIIDTHEYENGHYFA